MRRPIFFWIAAILGICSVPFLAGGALLGPGVFAQDEDEEEESEYVPELEDVRVCIEALDREGAEEALKAAKKELGSRKREKPVKAAIKALEKNIDALEEFEKAKEAKDKGKISKALKSMTKVMCKFGEIYFAEAAEEVYAELKQKVYYMINDFETEAYRGEKAYLTSRSGASVEVVSDRRLARDGRHALKVHFDKREEGVKEGDQGAYRAAVIETPDGFSRELENLKALTFSIFSYKKSSSKFYLAISGGGAASFAQYPGLTLNYVGWKDYAVALRQFKLNGSFKWRDGRRVIFATTGPLEADFIVDDVKFIK